LTRLAHCLLSGRHASDPPRNACTPNPGSTLSAFEKDFRTREKHLRQASMWLEEHTLKHIPDVEGKPWRELDKKGDVAKQRIYLARREYLLVGHVRGNEESTSEKYLCALWGSETKEPRMAVLQVWRVREVTRLRGNLSPTLLLLSRFSSWAPLPYELIIQCEFTGDSPNPDQLMRRSRSRDGQALNQIRLTTSREKNEVILLTWDTETHDMQAWFQLLQKNGNIAVEVNPPSTPPSREASLSGDAPVPATPQGAEAATVSCCVLQ